MNGSDPVFLTRVELADILRLSMAGLERLIHHPRRPLPRYKAGRRFLFDIDEVKAHLRVDARGGA